MPSSISIVIWVWVCEMLRMQATRVICEHDVNAALADYSSGEPEERGGCWTHVLQLGVVDVELGLRECLCRAVKLVDRDGPQGRRAGALPRERVSFRRRRDGREMNEAHLAAARARLTPSALGAHHEASSSVT